MALNLGFAAVSTPGANLGRGRINPQSGVSEGDPSWGEIYGAPALDWSAGVDRGTWYGQLSAVGAVTLGDGDPGGFSSGGDGSVDLEVATLGWRSAPAARPVFDVSVGRQELNIGDGFLIDDGNLDLGDDSGVWLAPRQAFQRTAIGRMEYGSLHLDLFYLQADQDHDDAAIAGGNLEVRFAEQGHMGFLYFHVVDAASPRFFRPRDGMDVVSVRVNDLRVPKFPNLALWSEYARESGSPRESEFSASAWYTEVIYTFTELPWTPRLSYRYAYFSGDANPGDAIRRDFDPFFYGFDQRSWSTWFQGEVTGGWLLFNSNQRNHLVKLSAAPTESLVVGVIGATFDLVESNYLGLPVTDHHFADELNLYTDWSINERVSVSAAYGVMFPGDGAVEAIGDDERYHIIEVGIYVSF